MCNSPEEWVSLTHVEFTRAAPACDMDTLVSSHTAALSFSLPWDIQSLRTDRKNFFLSLSRCFSTNCFSSKNIRANLSDWHCTDEVIESHMLDPWGSTNSSSTMGLSAIEKQTRHQCHNTQLSIFNTNTTKSNDPLVLTCSRYWVDTWGDQHGCCHQ